MNAIQLDKADFYELQALTVKLENARLCVENAQLVLQSARAASQAKLTALAEAHGFDPKQSYALDESTYSLREPPNGSRA